MARIIVFDVNETLLDMTALEPPFERLFGDRRALREWFSLVLLYSEVVMLTGLYQEFSTVAGAALEMLARNRAVTIADSDRDEILGSMLKLPPHADVRPALERLRAGGLRLVVLTNSAPRAVEAQLKNAGLADFFEHAFSVDAVRRFKPAPEPYQFVARELGVQAGRLRMVAAHGWDVLGAMRAGCAAAFVARPGQTLYPLAPAPDVVASDLSAVADRILAIEAGA